jgi:hypothetical protein
MSLLAVIVVTAGPNLNLKSVISTPVLHAVPPLLKLPRAMNCRSLIWKSINYLMEIPSGMKNCAICSGQKYPEEIQ